MTVCADVLQNDPSLKTLTTVAGVGMLLLLAAGCATPASRIRRDPELFASFPPEVREDIRRGQIDIGYSPLMVGMALGRPDRILDRVVQGARLEIWVYSEARYAPGYGPAPAAYWYRDSRGPLRRGYNWTWLDLGQPVEFEALRVEFAGNKVSAIERAR